MPSYQFHIAMLTKTATYRRICARRLAPYLVLYLRFGRFSRGMNELLDYSIFGSPWLRMVFVIFEIGISSLSTIMNDIFEVSPNSPPN